MPPASPGVSAFCLAIYERLPRPDVRAAVFEYFAALEPVLFGIRFRLTGTSCTQDMTAACRAHRTADPRNTYVQTVRYRGGGAFVDVARFHFRHRKVPLSSPVIRIYVGK